MQLTSLWGKAWDTLVGKRQFPNLSRQRFANCNQEIEICSQLLILRDWKIKNFCGLLGLHGLSQYARVYRCHTFGHYFISVRTIRSVFPRSSFFWSQIWQDFLNRFSSSGTLSSSFKVANTTADSHALRTLPIKGTKELSSCISSVPSFHFIDPSSLPIKYIVLHIRQLLRQNFLVSFISISDFLRRQSLRRVLLSFVIVYAVSFCRCFKIAIVSSARFVSVKWETTLLFASQMFTSPERCSST